ncbi:MAG: hypothetical protein ACFUZC_06200 [Chthoniobacteraceae bacterium]
MKLAAALPSLAFLLLAAVSQAVANDTPYTVECFITPKAKDGKPAKVISTNILLEEQPLSFPVVSPSNEPLIVTVCLLQNEGQSSASSDNSKNVEPVTGFKALNVNIQDLSRVTVTGSDRIVNPLNIFSAQLPYRPKEMLTLFENNDFTLSLLVKSKADK